MENFRGASLRVPWWTLSANSRNEFQLVDRRKMAPGYPAAAGLPAFSALLSPHHLRIGNLLANFVQCLVPFQRPRPLFSAGVFFEAKRFLGLLRPPTSSNHFVDLLLLLLLPSEIHRFVNEVTVCDSSCFRVDRF